MKLFTVPVLALACAASLSAAEVGLGFSVADNSSAITVPVRLNGGFTLEPSLAFYKSTDHYSDNSRSQRQFSLGLGLYKHQEIAASTEVFYGGGLGMNHYRRTNDGSSETYKTYGAQVALGLEYFVTKKVSFGGKAGLEFMHESYSGDETYRQWGTSSALFVRMYF